MLSTFDVLADGHQQVVFDVGQSSLQERVPSVLDPVCDPGLEMQELSLSCQYGQGDCELVVVPIGQGNQTFFDHLGNV